MNKVSGLSDDEIGDPVLDDMGDISVSGDSSSTTTNHYHGASGASGASRLLAQSIPFILSAGAGAAAIWAASHWPQSVPDGPPVESAEYEVRFFNSRGELIDIPRHDPPTE